VSLEREESGKGEGANRGKCGGRASGWQLSKGTEKVHENQKEKERMEKEEREEKDNQKGEQLVVLLVDVPSNDRGGTVTSQSAGRKESSKGEKREKCRFKWGGGVVASAKTVFKKKNPL